MAREKLDALGIDAVCARIVGGETLTALAAKEGIGTQTLLDWFSADAGRSARAREARRQGAATWDDKATSVIEGAKDPFELARAKELAHHYRWRASKADPDIFGEKTKTEHSGQVTVGAVDMSKATSEQLQAIAGLKLGGE